MWELYDHLLEPIPRGLKVTSAILGASWSLVEADNSVGVAATVQEASFGRRFPNWVGEDLRDLAEQVKSWNFQEASLGLAAINAWYHHPRQISALQQQSPTLATFLPDDNAFNAYASATTGKKVAFIGHFQHLENYLQQAATISVLERKPQPGDYPDTACEYLLPEQDFVFITGSSLINKTLPRLLQLSRQATVVLTGPSTPLTPRLFSFGVQECSGFIVSDGRQAQQVITQGSHKGLFHCGLKKRLVSLDL